MSTIEIKKYETFDYAELSEEAKETSFETWRDNRQEWDWIDENIDSLKAFANHFDVELKDYSLGGQGEGVFFQVNDEMENLEYVRLWKYLKNHNYEHVSYNHVIGCNPKTTTIYDSCPFTGYCLDETLLDNIKTFLERPYKTTFYDLIDSCFDKWLKDCRADMEHQTSEEYFKEEVDANEYKFLEDGTVYN
jgi:hypothetical protein